MDTVSRRKFLIASGVAGAGALAVGAGALSWRDVAHASATAGPRAAGTGVLVVVTLYGGNDGLNMVVPVSDPAYRTARPQLALTAANTLPLADGLALNGSMKGLKAQWDAGRLAIVRGVSYPDPSLSHFQSMDIWQTASPTDPASTGWLGRWLDATGTDPIRALAIDEVLPPLLIGAQSFGATVPGGPLTLPAAAFADPLWAMDTDAPGTASVGQSASPADWVRQSGLDLRTVAGIVDPVLTTGTAVTDSGPEGASATGGSLDTQLAVVAKLLAAKVATRVYAVSLGGFDTHSAESPTNTDLLGDLDSALTTFTGALAKSGVADDVTVLVYSEFGRRVQANASQGTDHGTANPVLVLGAPVRGGFVGEQPSLTKLDSTGNLIPTTDFRAVYATVLEGVLGGDVEQILGPDADKLGRLPLLV